MEDSQASNGAEEQSARAVRQAARQAKRNERLARAATAVAKRQLAVARLEKARAELLSPDFDVAAVVKNLRSAGEIEADVAPGITDDVALLVEEHSVPDGVSAGPEHHEVPEPERRAGVIVRLGCRCPECKAVETDPRKWRIPRRRNTFNGVMCLSCWRTRNGKKYGPARLAEVPSTNICPRCGRRRRRRRDWALAKAATRGGLVICKQCDYDENGEGKRV